MTAKDLARQPLHLGLGATAVAEPPFEGGMAWYDAYIERHRDDGAEGRLVSLHTFSAPWDMWEMHPHGAEVVVCVGGTLTLYQEREGQVTSVVLRTGQYAINDPGTWHTADVTGEATALFITAGHGTRHRPR